MKTIGSLASVAFALFTRAVGAQGGIVGTVYDSLNHRAPLANAIVVLNERNRFATTDARGRFRFDTVPDGRYTLGFTHAVLDSLDLELPLVPVEVTGGHRTTVALSTPSMATLLARLCPSTHDAEMSVIVGRVRDVDDHTPLADATVSTDWTEFTLAGGRGAGERVRDASRTNASGVYRLCGVPSNVPLQLEVEKEAFIAGPVPIALGTPRIIRVDFALSQRDSAARRLTPGDSSASLSERGSATLRGRVLGAEGQPLRDATVDVLGTTRRARTDSAGVFRVGDIPAGTRTLEVKSIGLAPANVTVDLATGSARDTTLSITRRAQALEADTVKGASRAISWMVKEGFEERRGHGLGAYVTEDQISRHDFPELSSVIRGVGGIRVECNTTTSGAGGVGCLPMPMMIGIADFRGNYCTPNYFLDGAPFPVANPKDFGDLAAMARPNGIRGIEVYSNPGTIPAQFDLTSSTGCGSIIIWTH